MFPHRHSPTLGELQTHLDNAAAWLKDSKNAAISDMSRFSLVYDAAHALTVAAVKMRGFRATDARGHRQIVFAAMEHAVPATEKDKSIFELAHRDRNKSEYEGNPINLPRSRLEGLIKATENLSDEVQFLFRQWQKDN